MPDFSLITSTFRAENYLPAYSQRVFDFAEQVKQAGLALELVLVANEASATEREQIEALRKQIEASQLAEIQVLYVLRETVYASWNRGVVASHGLIFGFWNVDDVRYAEGLIEAHQLLQQGYTVVDSPFEILHQFKWLGWFSTKKREIYPVTFDHEKLTRKGVLGTFFFASRAFYETVGGFDENFRVAGDLEWSARIMGKANLGITQALSGQFVIHGGNLSNTGNVREDIEVNIIFMRRQQWDEVRPTADPVQMKKLWDEWGNMGVEVPTEIEAMLWGEHALQLWQAWQEKRLRQQRAERWRKIPRKLIDTLGLRPVLARLGIVKA